MNKHEYYVEEVTSTSSDTCTTVYYIRHTDPSRYIFGSSYKDFARAKRDCASLNKPAPVITSRRVYPL